MPEMKNCETCGKEYRANSNGRFCSSRCYSKTVPSQYQKMKAELIKYRTALENIREVDGKMTVYAPDCCSGAYRIASEALGLPVYPKPGHEAH